jgi:hypothetical protein
MNGQNKKYKKRLQSKSFFLFHHLTKVKPNILFFGLTLTRAF